MSRPTLRIEHGGAVYRFPRLSAWDQFWLFGLVQPVLAARKRHPGSNAEWVTKLVDATGGLDEEGLERLLSITVGAAERLDAGRPADDPTKPRGHGPATWQPVWDVDTRSPLAADLDGTAVMLLVAQIGARNLRPFFDYEPLEFARTGEGSASYTPVSLPDGLDWFTLPVRRRMLSFEKLHDGTVDLADIWFLTDLISVDAENAARAQAAANPN